MPEGITEKDRQYLAAAGRSPELLLRQINQLKTSPPSLLGITAATLQNKGIKQLLVSEEKQAIQTYEAECHTKRWTKFVPASGAASRMFAPFYDFLKQDQESSIRQIFESLKRFPFYGIVYAKLMQKREKKIATEKEFIFAFLSEVLDPKGLGYPDLPKALIPFFADEKGQVKTALEAHILETLRLAQQTPVTLHLTISKNLKAHFETRAKQFLGTLPSRSLPPISIEYSFQHPLTDTPYSGAQGQLIRTPEGNIAFRKGGHGALLENINRLDTDCVWIKNVDNILWGTENQSGERVMQFLGGYLLTLQSILFNHLNTLETHKEQTELAPIIAFIHSHFDPDYRMTASKKRPYEILLDYLNRPLRVCGMIPNKGAKGGGPFWKASARGKSVQIVEGVELNLLTEEHQKALAESTHFNPVLMVCGLTNHKGEKFSLYDFRDDHRYMVSTKTHQNQPITILEWPGLWNGGMAEWNSVFIELSANTFHPVKTVLDLLR